MAKKISQKKLRNDNNVETLTQLKFINEQLSQCNPSDSYLTRRMVSDKNGNLRAVEVEECPYDELLKKKEALINMDAKFNENKNKITFNDVIEIGKIVVSTGTTIGLFYMGMDFEKSGCFTYETFKNFLRKPKI